MYVDYKSHEVFLGTVACVETVDTRPLANTYKWQHSVTGESLTCGVYSHVFAAQMILSHVKMLVSNLLLTEMCLWYTIFRYCSLVKECPLVEHLTSLSKREAGALLSVSKFNH